MLVRNGAGLCSRRDRDFCKLQRRNEYRLLAERLCRWPLVRICSVLVCSQHFGTVHDADCIAHDGTCHSARKYLLQRARDWKSERRIRGVRVVWILALRSACPFQVC
jgi:hypothetical protein